MADRKRPLKIDSALRRGLAVAVLVLLAGCGGRPYVYAPLESVDFRSRATVDGDDAVRISAAVPSAEETESLFGMPLYEQGVQPVWLEIENKTNGRLRYAHAGTDREYFSPLEVAYKNRKGLSDEGQTEMYKRLFYTAIPRYIEAGETISGFIFTHVRPGTKDFNVDIYAKGISHSFTFFITVPGFVPDHAEVDFQSLYAANELQDLDEPRFRKLLAELGCCSTDATGEKQGSPLNVVLVGEGRDIRYALLRAKWRETAANELTSRLGAADYFYRGRRQDALLRFEGGGKDDGYYELRLWLSPYRLDGTLVWLGQLRHFIEHRWIKTRPDPDIDNARAFMAQNLWYGQTLLKYALVSGGHAVSLEGRQPDFQGSEYFTNGFRHVFWLAGKPVSLLETFNAGWDEEN
jgi:hypothetical protein